MSLRHPDEWNEEPTRRAVVRIRSGLMRERNALHHPDQFNEEPTRRTVVRNPEWLDEVEECISWEIANLTFMYLDVAESPCSKRFLS